MNAPFMTPDHAHSEKQRFLHQEPMVNMPTRTFYGWLAMAFFYGAVAAIVVAGLTGWTI